MNHIVGNIMLAVGIIIGLAVLGFGIGIGMIGFQKQLEEIQR